MDYSQRKENNQDGTSLLDWGKAILVVIGLFFVYRFFQNSGLVGNVGVQGQGATLGISFLVGLVASFSSCLAVVGSIVIAFAEKYNAESENFFTGVVRPNLFFHIGRVATFFVLGSVLGAIGGTLNLAGNFVSAYTIIIAIVMGWLGLNILGIAPPISALGLRPPKFVSRFWAQAEKSEHKAAPFLLGAVTFFLPCGFTQSMQILALASGSAWRGAAILTAFSLGTAPVLFLLGISASWGKTKNLGFVRKAAGILILVFAVFTLRSGLALTKLGMKSAAVPSASDQSDSSNAPQEQVVAMKITASGFEPNVLNIRKNVPVKWVINGDQATGCTSRIVVPGFDIAKNITSGENIISFIPRDSGVVNFSCGMGMVRGKFIVQ